MTHVYTPTMHQAPAEPRNIQPPHIFWERGTIPYRGEAAETQPRTPWEVRRELLTGSSITGEYFKPGVLMYRRAGRWLGD